MPVNEMTDVLLDEHLRARGFFRQGDGGSVELSAPFRSEPALWRTPGAAPRLGEFTEGFLTGVLGYERNEVEALLAMGAIGCGL
jgi:crotonobetainyl-CoA:carnitine CoA-transferase CaiB-like acyl-CoA transferase